MQKTQKLTKADRRKLKEADRGLVDFLQVMRHFFGNLPQWLNGMGDWRHQSYIKYTQSDLISMGILKNVCGTVSLNQMNESFNDENCIRTLAIMSGNNGLDEMPDGDTLNYYLAGLSTDQLGGVRKLMVNALIRSKLFYKGRLLSKYWRVLIDGTGLFCFKERHCPHCLVQRRKDRDGNETVIYYHHVTEAKLVLSDNIVVSLGTEFIENGDENVTKQDCETNAAKRLLLRLKGEYPRLPVCLMGDGLYLTEPIMKMCSGFNWKYIHVLKGGGQKTVHDDYVFIRDGGGAARVDGIMAEKGSGAFVNHVEELAGKTETFNVFEYRYQKPPAAAGGPKEARFMWASNIELTEMNLGEMILAGRSRWKIENEGFNNQKNGIYKIQHLNSRDGNAMKNHYLLTQISDILMQLYLACNKLVKALGQSIKNTSSSLLESFRRHFVTDEDVFFINKYTTVRLL